MMYTFGYYCGRAWGVANEGAAIAGNALGFLWDLFIEVLFSKRNSGVGPK